MPVTATEDPRFETSVPEPELTPGTQQTLTVSITNDAEEVDDQVSTASNLEVIARSGSTPIDVVSGERRIDQLADGQTVTLTVTVEVPHDAPGGTYDLPLEIVYEYDGDERERTTVAARVELRERPIFTVETNRVDLHPRETGAVTLAVTNTGSVVANDTTATVSAPGQALSVGDAGHQAFLGSLDPGENETVTIPVAATSAATGKSHAVRVVPSYENTNGIVQTAPARMSGVTLSEDPRIVVTDTSGNVRADSRGTVEWTLENRGVSPLTAVTLKLESTDAAVSLGESDGTTRFFEQWAPGETKTVRTQIAGGETAKDGNTPIEASVVFDHAAGFQADAGPYSLGTPTGTVDTIRVSEVRLSHGGPQPVLRGSVTNTGTEPLENAVAVIDSRTTGVTVPNGRTTLGTLAPGQTKQIAAAVRTGAVDRHELEFDGVVRYDRAGDRTATEPSQFRVARSPTESLFTVAPENGTFEVDSSNVFRVRIENDGPIALTDIRARLQAGPPYESQSPSAYVSELAPGESTIVAFEVTTPDDGIPTTDALPLNLTAETPTEKPVADGPHLVPVTVETGEPTSGSTMIAILAIIAIIVMAGGWWWLNQ